jgi:hypothetical protein
MMEHRMRAFMRPAPRIWLARLWLAGRRILSRLRGSAAPRQRHASSPALAPTILATPAPMTRRTVIVSREHFPGEPFALTRRGFQDELELTIEVTPRMRRRRQPRRRGG